MTSNARAARVVVDVRAISDPLDYLIPADLEIDVGSVVRVPLRGRRVRGWVVGFSPISALDPRVRAGLVPIAAVSSPHPVIDDATLQLVRWAAHEYAGSPATVLSWATPAPLPRAPGDRVLAPAAPRPARRPRVGELTAAVAAGRPARAFVRTWPCDDGSATIAALAAAVPESQSTLVVAPPGRAPRFAEGVDLASSARRERTRAWEAATSGRARVVVAGRRGPFVPIPNLGLVIVAAEHSHAHKDDRTPALDARVVARELATARGIPFVAVGPTAPIGIEGVRAWSRAAGEPVLELDVPGTKTRWPRREISDLTAEPRSGPLGASFFTRVRDTIDAGGSALVFLNRRGTARGLVCRRCGRLATCERCDGLMRPVDAGLECGSCSFRLPFVACPACGSDQVRRVGAGVDRLRSELDRAFPETPIVLVQGEDTPAPTPGQIIVGTQAALRHRGAFDLVVMIDPDAQLGRPGVRSEEAAFAVLIDVAAAAKRGDAGGLLLVQTRRPRAPALHALRAADARIFEDAALERRRASALPPFRRVLAIESSDIEAVRRVTAELSAIDVEVHGPDIDPKPRALALTSEDRWHDVTAAARRCALAHPESRVRLVADPLDI